MASCHLDGRHRGLAKRGSFGTVLRVECEQTLRSIVTGLRLCVAVALASGFAASAARAADEKAGLSPLAAVGERLFVRHCAVCHGRSGAGDGPFAGILSVPSADLTRIAARRDGVFPRDEIAAYVDGRFVPPAHGTREMPIWGRWLGQPLTPDTTSDEAVRGEILALLTYVETLQRSAAGD